MGKEKDNLGNTGSQGGELSFPSGGQDPHNEKTGRSPAIKANVWRGEKDSRIQKALCPDWKSENFIKAVSKL